ncbi:quinone oxidoreductase [Pseudomonas sp. HN11]|uniref:quinone oxidoreductase family protein n=1 Tax=Pseudomonas sp. HN11 TaxID=1344094 RepID=UPI001F398805|nr:quinone oxidoreductase [Pseudomonas sp. HN11]UII73436.1 quinone oxidoreductase [Pseudomonas sp. HN11]
MNTMKAVMINAFGGPEVLAVQEVSLARPGPGQALVQVMAAGVNFMDTGARRGLGAAASPLPLTLGAEGAGVVLAIGPDVTDVVPGDRVAWYYVPGSYAQQVIAPVSQLVPLPDDIGFETAAGLMMQGLTASNLVFDVHALQKGDVAFIHAAAGGVGLMLTQMVKLLGGQAIGRVSHADKVDSVLAAGADYVVIGRAGHIAGQVERLVGEHAVNVVYDGTGSEGFSESLNLLDYFGTLALFGPFMDPIAPIDIFSIPRSIKLTYPVVMHHVRSRETLLARTQQLFTWVRTGRLNVNIGQRYSLAQAHQAHRDIESRRSTGKLIILPQE